MRGCESVRRNWRGCGCDVCGFGWSEMIFEVFDVKRGELIFFGRRFFELEERGRLCEVHYAEKNH